NGSASTTRQVIVAPAAGATATPPPTFAAPAPTATVTAPAPPRLSVPAQVARVSAYGIARVRLACPGDRPCRGTVTLSGRVVAARGRHTVAMSASGDRRARWAAFCVLAGLAFVPATAVAAPPTHNPHGHILGLIRAAHGRPAPASPAPAPPGATNLDYHGGP